MATAALASLATATTWLLNDDKKKKKSRRDRSEARTRALVAAHARARERWPDPVVYPSRVIRDCADDAPDALVCPITQAMMSQPAIVLTTGRTYERAAIERWIRSNPTDPLDRESRVELAHVAPNVAIRDAAFAWGARAKRRRHAESAASSATRVPSDDEDVFVPVEGGDVPGQGGGVVRRVQDRVVPPAVYLERRVRVEDRARLYFKRFFFTRLAVSLKRGFN